MFKKLLIIIPVLAIIIAALLQGTQTRISVGEEGQRVVLATDAGVIDDKSFNQDAFLGVRNFVQDFYGLDGTKNNYVDGAENSKIGILNNYKLALLKGANAIVAPGFPHVEPLNDPMASFLEHTTVILLEGIIERDNIISVVFHSELAGLQAGFDAAV
jgi:basic membrane lipoprotein Med (substrate-binding protein (PBP1-ABC) superfamily)